MGHLIIEASRALNGSTRVPGDKSISHRAVLLGAIAQGPSRISGFLPALDCQATLSCVRALGVGIQHSGPSELTIDGRGLDGLRSPTQHLDCMRSGTTMRLLTGMLAGQRFDSTLTGHPQLLQRPMRRVVEPLRKMGARIDDSEGRAPLTVRGRRLFGAEHSLSVASAQVKSALLLAGLFAKGTTRIEQPGPARDHTERMLSAMGASVSVAGFAVSLMPGEPLKGLDLEIPGDISSAAYLIVAATLVPGSKITIRDVGVNPTRTGLLDVLQSMGADVKQVHSGLVGGEPVADLEVCATELRGTEISGNTVVRMIDEFPILAVAATQAHGTTVVRDATELRVKETDRIAAVASGLHAMGAQIETRPDGFAIEGPTPLRAASVNSCGDHRIAMAFAIAGLLAAGATVVVGSNCISDSFPGFHAAIQRLAHDGR